MKKFCGYMMWELLQCDKKQETRKPDKLITLLVENTDKRRKRLHIQLRQANLAKHAKMLLH